jgi:transposase-like protein
MIIWSCPKSVEMIIFAFLFINSIYMKHTQAIQCPHCVSTDLQKNGHSENNTQRWRCVVCRKSFQLSYTYNARKPGVKEQILELTLNGSGVRDIGRVLKINPDTVSAELKKNAKREPLCT